MNSFIRAQGPRRMGRKAALRRLELESVRAVRDEQRQVATGELEPSPAGGRRVMIPVYRRPPKGESTRASLDAHSAARFGNEPRTLNAKRVGAGQEAFDKLVERLVIEQIAPSRDYLTMAEMYSGVMHLDPAFTLEKFGGVTFAALIRNCKFLDSYRGKLQFMRLYDASSPDRDVTVGLAPYEYNTTSFTSTAFGEASTKTPPPRRSVNQLRFT